MVMRVPIKVLLLLLPRTNFNARPTALTTMRAVLGLAFLAAAALAQTVVDPPTQVRARAGRGGAWIVVERTLELGRRVWWCVCVQVRLAFAGNDGNGRSDGMSFVWATNNATATSVVRVGSTPAPSSMTITASGTQATYWQTWLHTAVVTGLQACVRGKIGRAHV